MLFLNSIELFEVKTNVFSDSYKFICFDDLILSRLKIRLVCTYIPQNSSKSLIFFSKMNLIRHFISKKFPFLLSLWFLLTKYRLEQSKHNLQWLSLSFIKFCSDNIFTQLIDSPIHKDTIFLTYTCFVVTCFVIIWVWIKLSFIWWICL